MCHHELCSKSLKERNIYINELYSTIASLRSPQWRDEDMGSKLVHNQDPTQNRQKLFGAGLQHGWTTPMDYKVPDWSGNPASEPMFLTIFGSRCWDWLSGVSLPQLWRNHYRLFRWQKNKSRDLSCALYSLHPVVMHVNNWYQYIKRSLKTGHMLQHCKQYSVQMFLSTWFRAKHVRATFMTEIKSVAALVSL